MKPQKPQRRNDSSRFSLPRNSSYTFIPYTPTISGPSHPLTIHHPSTYTYAGPLLTSLPTSFHVWTHRTFSSPSILLSLLTPLLTFLSTFLPSVGLNSYCLSIRASKADSAYDIPRWHVDDDFFVSSWEDKGGRKKKNGTRWKLCITLLGAGTLFPVANTCALKILRREKAHEKTNHEHICTSIRCLGCATYATSLRNILLEKLKGWETTAPNNNELAVFRIGDHGAVHSEPMCTGDRVFVNVVPGSEGEVRGLIGKWGMVEWPRGWSVDGV
jgi:hypothetical protein